MSLYYIHSKKHQNKRDGSMLWWGKDHKGYTFDMRCAVQYTLEEAREIARNDGSVAYRVEEVDKKITHNVEQGYRFETVNLKPKTTEE